MEPKTLTSMAHQKSMRESPAIMSCYLSARFIPKIQEEFRNPDTASKQHEKKHFLLWLEKYERYFKPFVKLMPYTCEISKCQEPLLRTNQQSCQAVISFSRALHKDFDFEKFANSRNQLMLPTNEFFTTEDVTHKFEKLIEDNKDDPEKKKLLNDSKEQINKYLKFNIDFERDFLLKLDSDKIPEIWKSTYDIHKALSQHKHESDIKKVEKSDNPENSSSESHQNSSSNDDQSNESDDQEDSELDNEENSESEFRDSEKTEGNLDDINKDNNTMNSNEDENKHDTQAIEKNTSSELGSNLDQNEKKKIFYGTMVLPVQVQVHSGVSKKAVFSATLKQINEDDWTGLVKWESTKEEERVDLDRILHPDKYGQRSRDYKSTKIGSEQNAYHVTTSVLKKANNSPASTVKKRGRPRKQCRSPEKLTAAQELERDWYAEETEKKQVEFREMFDLPSEGEYTLHQLHTGYVNSIKKKIKSAKDADLAHR